MKSPRVLRCRGVTMLFFGIAAMTGCGGNPADPETLADDMHDELRERRDPIDLDGVASPELAGFFPVLAPTTIKPPPPPPPPPPRCRIVRQPVRGAAIWTASADFDGDGRDDVATKQDDGEWSIDHAADGFGTWDAVHSGFGRGHFQPVPADYDGDCKADLSTKDDEGAWYIDYSYNGFGAWDVIRYGYGGKSAIPVPGDYDGDGRVDLSVKDHGSKLWRIDYAADGFGAWNASYPGYGGVDYTPVPADYDGDGRADISTKSDGGLWLIDHAANGFGPWDAVHQGYGRVDHLPVPADYDGDGSADLAVRDTTDRWFIDYAADGLGVWNVTRTGLGAPGTYLPVPADYDGDGKTDVTSHTDRGDWLLDYAADGFGAWNESWNSYVTVSAGAALSADDIGKFDRKWMQMTGFDEHAAGRELCARNGAASWFISDRMTAMVRLYELTHERRYVDHLAAIAREAMKYRDDRYPDRSGPAVEAACELLEPRPFDAIQRMSGLPAWGGRGVNSGGLHRVDEVISSLYGYPIAAFARLVAENPALHETHGRTAIEYTEALLDTVAVFLPQIRTKPANGYREAYLVKHENFANLPTADDCARAYQAERAALGTDPPEPALDRLERMLSSCRKAALYAGHPLPHNIQSKFSMLLIELDRMLSTSYYENTSSNAGATWWRAQIPVLVSQLQRYFANSMQLAGSGSAERYYWNYADGVPSGQDLRYDDASHAAVSLGYIDLLSQNFTRLSASPLLAREPIEFDSSDLERYANTVLFMTGNSTSADAHMAENVAGEAATPLDYRDGTCDGHLHMTAGDPRVFDVCKAISLRLKDGGQAYLGIGNHSALLAKKRVRYFASRPRLDTVLLDSPTTRLE